MFSKHFFNRILRDRTKLLFIIVIVLIPLLDIVDIFAKMQPLIYRPRPEFATFLSMYPVGTSHLLHKMMFWFLPLYLLIICSEGSLEDNYTGYKQIMIERMGRKGYIKSKLVNSFLCGTSIIVFSLALNFILVEILFFGGETTKLLPPEELDSLLYTISYSNPIITNIIYIFVTGVLAGLIACVGTALSLALRNRKTVYAITFFLWFVPVMIKDSLMLVIQPFMEYDFEVVIPTFILIVVSYLIIIIIACIAEKRHGEI